MTHNLPAIDIRRRVRLWDADWRCIADERVEDDQRPIDVIDGMMGPLADVRATIERAGWQTRWSGFFYRDGAKLRQIDNGLLKDLIEWPEPQG